MKSLKHQVAQLEGELTAWCLASAGSRWRKCGQRAEYVCEKCGTSLCKAHTSHKPTCYQDCSRTVKVEAAKAVDVNFANVPKYVVIRRYIPHIQTPLLQRIAQLQHDLSELCPHIIRNAFELYRCSGQTKSTCERCKRLFCATHVAGCYWCGAYKLYCQQCRCAVERCPNCERLF